LTTETKTKATTATHTIVHYELPAKDAAALRTFYGNVFGWEFSTAPNMETYFMANPGGSEDLAIAIYPRENEGSGPTNYISVEDVKTYADRITGAGGKVLHSFTVGGMGHGAIAADPEGNMVGLWQRDPSAKEIPQS
jgi:predicted enzyme related to lactoylglutathione lyase